MQLKVNSSYAIDTGYIIPRSHMHDGDGEKYCIVQILTGGATHYTSRHTTMTSKELKKVFKLSQKERITIL